jgi:putative colanic acid biosysnthesis UDP-glucose lipid carrier transferase
MLVVLAAGVSAYVFRFGTVAIPDYYQLGLTIAILLTLVVFPFRPGAFRETNRFTPSVVVDVSVGWGSVLLILVLLSVATKTTDLYSRLWFLYLAVSGWVLLLLFRFAVSRVLRMMHRRGWRNRRVLILGGGALGQEVANRIGKAGWCGFEIRGFLDDHADMRGSRQQDLPVLGSLDEVLSVIEKEGADEVWLALPLQQEERIRELEYQLRGSPVTLRFIPNLYGFRLLQHTIGEVAGVPMLNLSDTPMRGVNRLIKAMEDRLLAALILLAVSPAMILIALAIRVDSPGPVLFRQMRHGWDGRPIEVWKFRSMRDEPEGARYLQARRDDPRVTRVGSFLRRTSLDELPQFINVLQGRMSVVGPRPHPIQMNEFYMDQVDSYMRRHKVKPGITGWAQVNGHRGETESLEKIMKRVEFDLYYIENWSLWLDLKIIWLTLGRWPFDANAY